MNKIRHTAITFFEIAVYASAAIGVLFSIVGGLTAMSAFGGGFFYGMVLMIGGVIASIVAAGAALTLVGIYHNSRSK